jgi:hypothetical protein
LQIETFPPAFLISQKSEIFDSFPPGEAFGCCRTSALNDNFAFLGQNLILPTISCMPPKFPTVFGVIFFVVSAESTWYNVFD